MISFTAPPEAISENPTCVYSSTLVTTMVTMMMALALKLVKVYIKKTMAPRYTNGQQRLIWKEESNNKEKKKKKKIREKNKILSIVLSPPIRSIPKKK